MNNYEAINAELKAYCLTKLPFWLEDDAKAAYDRLQEKFGDTLSDEVYVAFGKETVDHVVMLFEPRSYTWHGRFVFVGAMFWRFLLTNWGKR